MRIAIDIRIVRGCSSENVGAAPVWVDPGEAAFRRAQRRGRRAFDAKAEEDIALAVRGQRRVDEDGSVIGSGVREVGRQRCVKDFLDRRPMRR